jgi:hypothetical protein
MTPPNVKNTIDAIPRSGMTPLLSLRSARDIPSLIFFIQKEGE